MFKTSGFFSGILEIIYNMLWKLRICRALLLKVLHQENVISFRRICMLEVFSVSVWSLLAFFLITHSNLSFFLFFFSGEDALANLSIERTEAGTITGHVRIRSKTQGIALSLGDRITMGMCSFSFFGKLSRLIFKKNFSSPKRWETYACIMCFVFFLFVC